MNDYKEMYLHLFREVTEIIEKLQLAQQKTEEIFMSSAATDSIIEICTYDKKPNTTKENGC